MDRENFMALSGADYIRAMYANTIDGKLEMEEEGFEPEILKLDWNEAILEEVVARFEKLQSALSRLGREHAYWSISTKDMPEELLEVWNTYILPYPDHGMDEEALFDAGTKAECGMDLTEEEEELLEKHMAWMREHALSRLPYNRKNPAGLIQRARRYEKLVSLHAPKVVVDNEGHSLAEELVVYYCLAE